MSAGFNDEPTSATVSVTSTIPHAPSLPSGVPFGALALAANAGGGHGLSLLLLLATAGWALVLSGRRVSLLARIVQQPTYLPLVSPG